MQFANIEAIMAHKFYGAIVADQEAVDAMWAFAEDASNSMADRAKALRHVDVNSGYTCDALVRRAALSSDEEMVARHAGDAEMTA